MPQHSGQHRDSGPSGGMLVVLSQHTHPAVLGSWLVQGTGVVRKHAGSRFEIRMLTSIWLQEGPLLVSGRAELGGPQLSKRPTAHLKLALPRAASSSARSFPGILQWLGT